MRARRVAALVLSLMVLLPALPVQATGVNHLLITAVYYDTYVGGEGDEFVRITNPTTSSISIKSWKLTDGEGTLTFPSTSIAAGASIYVTGKATDFRLDMVVTPQFEYKNNSDPNVTDLRVSGTFALANAGDEVQLQKSDGTVVDAVVYGGGNTSFGGWSGAAIPGVPEGTILERDLDEATGQYVDTDAAADWDDARHYVVGQSHVTASKYPGRGNVTVFTSPDSGYDAVSGFLNTTKTSLDLTVYEFTNPYLGDVLRDRAKAGVKVRVLVEGDPVGFGQDERDQQNWILDRLLQAGGEARYLISNATQGIHDRYDYVHAKYALADGARALVLSGNWKTTSLPVSTTWGNREWGVIVEDKNLTAGLGKVFADDWDSAHRDILSFNQGTDARYLAPNSSFQPDRNVSTGKHAPAFPAKTFSASFNVTPVLSPDTSLLNQSGLRPLLRGAKTELLVEQLSAHKHWGSAANGTPLADPDPYVEDSIQAARNGAKVYLLLDSAFIDRTDTRNNQATVDYVNGIAQNESLTLYARLVNSTALGILKVHNKGVVVDNQTAVVGSLNWVLNSAQENRELALILESPTAAAYFRDVFWTDWNASA